MGLHDGAVASVVSSGEDWTSVGIARDSICKMYTSATEETVTSNST